MVINPPPPLPLTWNGAPGFAGVTRAGVGSAERKEKGGRNIFEGRRASVLASTHNPTTPVGFLGMYPCLAQRPATVYTTISILDPGT